MLPCEWTYLVLDLAMPTSNSSLLQILDEMKDKQMVSKFVGWVQGPHTSQMLLQLDVVDRLRRLPSTVFFLFILLMSHVQQTSE